MWYHVVWQIATSIFQEPAPSIVRLKDESLFYLEDGGWGFLQIVVIYLKIYTASHPISSLYDVSIADCYT